MAKRHQKTNGCYFCGSEIHGEPTLYAKRDFCSEQCANDFEYADPGDPEGYFFDYGPVDSDPYDTDGPYY